VGAFLGRSQAQAWRFERRWRKRKKPDLKVPLRKCGLQEHGAGRNQRLGKGVRVAIYSKTTEKLRNQAPWRAGPSGGTEIRENHSKNGKEGAYAGA